MKLEKLTFRYPNLSAGYLGIESDKATLNSAFYAKIYNEVNPIDHSIIFPQRVLKKDFFDEISMLEGDIFSDQFKVFRFDLSKRLQKILLNLHDNSIELINSLNLLLRYGLFEDICAINSEEIKGYLDPSDFIEVNLIKEIARFRLSSNDDPNMQVNALAQLGDIVLSENNLTKRIKVLVLNFLVVIAYRYGAKFNYEKHLSKFYQKLIDLITENHEEEFGSKIRESVAYRGLAMVKEIGQEMQSEFLQKAESIARNIRAKSGTLEDIIAKENLYTCIQTLSKWNMYRKKPNLAEINLNEMISIDPFDSTAYGELGFFLLNNDRYDEAAEAFDKAARLGPPAVGMHTYYYAKCLQAMNRDNDAAKILYEVTKLDKNAVSPWFDLVEHNVNIKNPEEAKKIAERILNNQIYKEQLDDEEILMLNNLLES